MIPLLNYELDHTLQNLMTNHKTAINALVCALYEGEYPWFTADRLMEHKRYNLRFHRYHKGYFKGWRWFYWDSGTIGYDRIVAPFFDDHP